MIVKSVVLNCSVERAFALFTQRAGEWWPANRRHTKDTSSTIHVEATGRFFERATDGTEVELGRLHDPQIAYEHPFDMHSPDTRIAESPSESANT